MSWSFPELFWARSTGVPVELLRELTPASAELREAEARLDEIDRELLASITDRRVRRRIRKRRPDLGIAFDRAAERASILETIRLAEQQLDAFAPRRDLPQLEPLAWMSSRGLWSAVRDPRSSRRRTLLLQRAVLKTELSGGYGPYFWGSIDPALDAVLECEAGPTLVRSRRIFFEHWAMRALALRLAAEASTHCRPRLSASCVLDGRRLSYPVGRKSDLEDLQLAAIQACDGRTLEELRAGVSEEVARALEELIARGVLESSIPIPSMDPEPEQQLIAFARALPDPIRSKWLPELERMIVLRDRILESDLFEERRTLESELDDRFEALAQAPASRPGAKHARFIIREDCERNVDLRLGKKLLGELKKIEPVLELARWCAGAWARDYEHRLLPIFSRLAAGVGHVDFALFVRETKWISDSPEISERVRSRLADAWSDRLGERAGERRRLALTAADFDDVLSRLPPVDGLRWLPAAGVHALSVMIAGSNRDAINAGEYLLVLHRLYQGVPMLVHPAAAVFCPDLPRVGRIFASWIEEPLIQLSDAPSTHHRSNLNLPNVAPIHEALLPGSASLHPPERTASIGELEVVERGGQLFVRTRDRRVESPLLAVRWPLLQAKLLEVSVLPERERRSPRIVLDRWVLARARWRLSASCVLAPGATIGARRAWRRRLDLPRHVFVRSEKEPSDVYIDLDAPAFVDVLRAIALHTDELSIFEAIPEPDDHMWLSDYAGRHFACELRLTALADRQQNTWTSMVSP